MLDIVGARFHCAICDSVDICANCESAGLPGNLDSADGGHNSSHILIKVRSQSLTFMQPCLPRCLPRQDTVSPRDHRSEYKTHCPIHVLIIEEATNSQSKSQASLDWERRCECRVYQEGLESELCHIVICRNCCWKWAFASPCIL